MLFINEKAIQITISIIVNFLDYTMVYYLCHNFMDKKIVMSKKLTLLGIIFATFSGVISNIVGGYVYRIISMLIILLILKLVSKRKNYNVLILFMLILACMMIIQTVILLILRILNIDSSNLFLFSLLGQILTLISVLFICARVPLHKVLDIIERKVLIKFLIIIVTTIFLVIFTILDFDIESITLPILFLLILTSIIFQTLKEVFFYANRVLHDLSNMIMGVHITAYSTTDIMTIRDSLEQCLAIMNIDATINHIDIDEYNNNILAFIHEKRYKNTKEFHFITDIQYDEANVGVSLSVILYMLGVLLDNAIESGTKKPIFIKVHVIEEYLHIAVANEYKRRSKNDFEKMFKEGYSTKEKHARGYGLPNLRKAVSDYGGDILIDYSYNKEHKSDYLTIIIEI